jgi:tetratricopeptide (TPR) repeat protein
MKQLITLLFLCSASYLFAQSVPMIKVGSDNLGITSLDINVAIVGNQVTTTYDMLFYNPTKSVLEGELAFPLGENQHVSRLALEVSGNLREAVVVEKEIGRVAFEAVVRRGVDPVLLEKGTGNNYKARIYPIPAMGHKRVVLAYEQKLNYSELAHFYELPLQFQNTLDHFSIAIVAFDQNTAPMLVSGRLAQFSFIKKDTHYVAHTVVKKQALNTVLKFKIPLALQGEKIITYEDYAYIYKTLHPTKRKKSNPKSIHLFWDVSYSMKDRDVSGELLLLDAYFKYLQNVEVQVSLFSNVLLSNKKFTVRNGEWNAIKEILQMSTYDGGTSYRNLFQNLGADEVLLFSDGMNNLSALEIQSEQPFYIINSITKGNHSKLHDIVQSTSGQYINLKTLSSQEALDLMVNQSYTFLGVKTPNNSLEIYPNTPQLVGNDFSIAIKNLRQSETIILQFGYGKEVVQEYIVRVHPNTNTSEKAKRFWGREKLKALTANQKSNKKAAIIAVSKAYGIISDYTSLIVLETAADYAIYEITPPEELMDEYLKILEANKGKKIAQYNKEEEDKVQGNIINGMISGTVVDDDGLPLPTATVLIKGTTTGTTTDFNGNYSIAASSGQVLQFSFVGYGTLETTVGNANIVNITMQADASLEEVVVTAIGIRREKKAIGYAVSTINANQLTPGGYSRPGYSSPTNRIFKSKDKKLFVKKRIVKTPYLLDVRKAKSTKEAYIIYINNRPHFETEIAYFIDMHDYFIQRDKKIALKILSNIVELDFDNYELLRAFAYKLEENNHFELAAFIYKRILELRPEDAQSYRDLALIFQELGDYEEAHNMLQSIVDESIYKQNTNRRKFAGLQRIAQHELQALKAKINTEGPISEDAKQAVRIVIDWNHNDTDIDLYVIDPNKEACYYSHSKTKIGGVISEDMTQGFGPEEYTLKHPYPGDYFIKVNYYGDRDQRVSRPTFMKVTIFKNFGTASEEKEVKVIRIDRHYKNEMVAKLRL